MNDRVSLYPGRVLITPEDGSPAFYATMTRADEPTQAGDPLNKATLLSDSVAAMYGLDGATVPNDLFGYVGEYAQHQWFRKVVPNFLPVPVSEYTKLLMHTGEGVGGTGTTYSFFTNIETDLNRELVLGGAEYSDSINYTTMDDLYDHVGQYFEKGGAIYLIDAGSVVTGEVTGGTYYVYVTAREMTYEDRSAPGPDTYLRSSDANAYPHSGESGGYAYTYLGRSMEHVLREPVRMVQGIYLGNGEAGYGALERLTFPFNTLLALFVVTESENDEPALIYLGQPGTSINEQANTDGVYYHYVAFGIDSDRKEN